MRSCLLTYTCIQRHPPIHLVIIRIHLVINFMNVHFEKNHIAFLAIYITFEFKDFIYNSNTILGEKPLSTLLLVHLNSQLFPSHRPNSKIAVAAFLGPISQHEGNVPFQRHSRGFWNSPIIVYQQSINKQSEMRETMVTQQQ